jgi:hypothetical protein
VAINDVARSVRGDSGLRQPLVLFTSGHRGSTVPPKAEEYTTPPGSTNF